MNFREEYYGKDIIDEFILENFIKKLNHICESDCKSAIKVRRLKRIIDEAEKYAIECGQLPRKRPFKK